MPSDRTDLAGEKLCLLVGGVGRAGKSTLASNLARRLGWACLHMDHLSAILRLEDGGDMPRAQADRVALAASMQYAAGRAGRYVDHRIVEGSMFEPVAVEHALSGTGHVSVFVGFADVDVEEKLGTMRRFDVENWIRRQDDDALRERIRKSIDRSRRLRDECARLGLRYVEVGENARETLSRAADEIETDLRERAAATHDA